MEKKMATSEIKENVVSETQRIWSIVPAASIPEEKLVQILEGIPKADMILSSVKSIISGGVSESKIRMAYTYKDLNEFGIPISTRVPNDCYRKVEHRRVYVLQSVHEIGETPVVSGVMSLGTFNRIEEDIYGYIEIHLHPDFETSANYADVYARMLCYLHIKSGLKNPLTVRVPNDDTSQMFGIKELAGYYATDKPDDERSPDYEYAAEEFKGSESSLFIFWNQALDDIPYDAIVNPIA